MEDLERIQKAADHVFDVMEKRVSREDLQRIKDAYALAELAHRGQKRNTGEPYIIHPIAVATIAAEELELDANTVIAAFLHDVVEDTEYTLDDIRARFGDDVTFLVDAVTSLERQEAILDLVTEICETDFQFDHFEDCVAFFRKLINLCKQMNYCEFKSADFNNYQTKLNELLKEKQIA